ncbi:conserved protein of unknown function [Georgfuchsia toluolica]|uniref:UPF0225 protein GTOL_10382 n=1 Tax=Georgfuchsia toluolica TaxID=424218 RepID=A0A916N1C3_9PROT|nr:YchJ family metal-binding protein [Georgfuchsia toluolica]CAG4882500.1 conserved protein of unknown function [Georgfuchsia toluolica]
MANRAPDSCPCGNPALYELCCGRYIDGGLRAPTAEALMRSRYTAYALGREAYVRETWHPATRPGALDLDDGGATKWIGLDVKRHELQDQSHATVEFIARYKINGRAHRLHELSRFICVDDQWFYVDGDIRP